MNYFARYLRRLRKERSLTQKELADLTGLSIYKISSFESGKATPRHYSLDKLDKSFNLPATSLHTAQLHPESTLSRKELTVMFEKLLDLNPSPLHVWTMLELI